MKTLLVRVLLAVTILWPVLAPAELILYNGTRKDTYSGEGRALVVVWKMILVVDYDTEQVASLQYATINGVRRYVTNQWTNTHFVLVAGAHGGSTIIAHSLTQCESDSGITTEGVDCKGLNTTLKINTHSTVIFPKTLSASGSGLFDSSPLVPPILLEGSYQLVFDGPATLTSNKAGETFAAVFSRLTANVVALGYGP